MIDEAVTPGSFRTGRESENYVRRNLFPEKKYTCVERVPDFDRHDFVESSLKPDFRFREKSSGREFYVEAKFRRFFIF